MKHYESFSLYPFPFHPFPFCIIPIPSIPFCIIPIPSIPIPYHSHSIHSHLQDTMILNDRYHPGMIALGNPQMSLTTMDTILAPYNMMPTIQCLQYDAYNTMPTIQYLQCLQYNAYNTMPTIQCQQCMTIMPPSPMNGYNELQCLQWIGTMWVPHCKSWASARNEQMFFYSLLVNHPRTSCHRPLIGGCWERLMEEGGGGWMVLSW